MHYTSLWWSGTEGKKDKAENTVLLRLTEKLLCSRTATFMVGEWRSKRGASALTSWHQNGFCIAWCSSSLITFIASFPLCPKQEELGSRWMLWVTGREACWRIVWVSAIRAWLLGAQGRKVQGSPAELVSQRSQDSTEELGGIPRLCFRVGRSHMGYTPVCVGSGWAGAGFLRAPSCALGAGKVLVVHSCVLATASALFSPTSLPQ